MSPSARVHPRSRSSTPAAHHDCAVLRDDLWVQISADNRPYNWHQQERRGTLADAGIRPGFRASLRLLLKEFQSLDVHACAVRT